MVDKKEHAKLNAVLKGLTGVTEIKQPDSLREQVSQQHALMTGLYDPPTYFVFMLMKIANFTAYSDWDKSRWQFYVQYKDVHFCIRDWKMSAWSIDTLETSLDKESALHIAEELRRRVVNTSRSLDKLLQPELQEFIAKNNYALPNPYRHLHSLYSYFQNQVQETQSMIKQLESSKKSGTEYSSAEDFFSSRVDIYNRQLELERISSYNACAMVSFFFSYIEFLMDVLYIFYPVAGTTLHDFQNQKWRERFNRVFPVNKDKDVVKIYRKLLEIRDDWRNVIEHGFRSEKETLLIPLPGLGLVPISYVNASKAIHFSITPTPQNGVQDALDVFSSFDAWVVSNPQTACIILFAQSDTPIPLMEQRLQEIRGWMSSPETLKKALDAEEDALQYWLDQYQ